jgi:hypothetical protein
VISNRDGNRVEPGLFDFVTLVDARSGHFEFGSCLITCFLHILEFGRIDTIRRYQAIGSVSDHREADCEPFDKGDLDADELAQLTDDDGIGWRSDMSSNAAETRCVGCP